MGSCLLCCKRMQNLKREIRGVIIVAKMIIVCLLMLGVLTFASTALLAEAPVGVPPLKCNTVGEAAPNQAPTATTNCGDYTCANNGTCCGDRTCCPSGYNLYCKNNNKCYTSVSAAQAACGNSYYICSVPAK